MKTLLFLSLLVLLPCSSLVAVMLALGLVVSRVARPEDPHRFQRAGLVGLLVPLCGVFPDSVSGFLLLTLLALDGGGQSWKDIRWAAPFGIVVLIWAAARVLLEFDSAPFVSLYHGYDGAGRAGFLNILRWFRGSGPGYLVACEDAIKVLIIVALATTLEGDRGRSFSKGLVLGGVVCALAALVETVSPGNFAFIRASSPFWSSIHRVRGLATDPNALGVLAGALIPLACLIFGRRSLPLVLVLVVGGVLSGSRTFFLLPLMAGAYLAIKERGWRVWVVGGAVVVSLCGVLILATPYLPYVPTGLVRLQESLNPARLSQTLHSRTVFTTLSLAVFKDFPLFGAGLGRFDDYVVPYAHQLNLGIGVWRDGAVSVYLEILAELGLVGAVLLLVSACARVPVQGGSRVFKGVGIAYLIILAVLPHTNFPEGVALAGLLLAQTTRARVAMRSWIVIPVAALFSLSIPFVYSSRALYGFYPWEKAGGEFVRWTALEAAGSLPCSAEVPLRLRNETPIAQSIEVVSGGKKESDIVPQGGSYEPILRCENGRAHYRLNVFPGFTPSKYGFTGDERLLGIRQLSSVPVP